MAGEAVVERPDVANAKANQRNAAFFPNVITEIQPNFGVKDQAIYIYNVAPLEHNEPRYPNHPHMHIKPCPKGQPYVLANSITHPFRENYRDENGNLQVRLTDGFREATKMLSPANPGIDQNYEEDAPLNVGGNLNNYGVFWSTTLPPSDQEIAAANERVAKTFKKELEVMAGIEAGPGGADEARGRANKISHAAAEYYGVSTSWHRSDLVPKQTPGAKIACPNCEEQIPAASAVCRHCDAVLDEEKAKKLFPDRFKRGPGRPAAGE